MPSLLIHVDLNMETSPFVVARNAHVVVEYGVDDNNRNNNCFWVIKVLG